MKKFALLFLSFLVFGYSSFSQDKGTLDSIALKKKDLKGKNYKYKGTILTTNFTLPVVKFNRFENEKDGSKGSVSFFNSVGAGITVTGGEMREIRDENGEIISQDFTPTIGGTFGVLFSSSTGEDPKNSFAPFVGLSVLDFQIGYGRELGAVPENFKRSFYTVSYNIPLYKLKRGMYYLLCSGDIIDDTDIKTGRIGSN